MSKDTDIDRDDEPDDVPDIVEVQEMTEMAEDAINYFFSFLRDKSKINIKVLDNGGASVSYLYDPSGDGGESKTLAKLIIYANGEKYAFSSLEKVEFYNIMNRLDLANTIRMHFGVDTTEDLPTEETKPVVIKLKKGFNKQEIRRFVDKVDKFLISIAGEKTSSSTPPKVTVVTEEWLGKDNRPFMIIPGAKRMFARFSEEGLLSSLFLNGFSSTAEEVYCIAYIKGKVKDYPSNLSTAETGKGVEFKNVDLGEFKKKLLISASALHEIRASRTDEIEDF